MDTSLSEHVHRAPTTIKFNVLTLDLYLALRRNGNTADIHLDKHGSTLSNQHEPKDNGNNTCKVKPRFMDTTLI